MASGPGSAVISKGGRRLLIAAVGVEVNMPLADMQPLRLAERAKAAKLQVLIKTEVNFISIK